MDRNQYHLNGKGMSGRAVRLRELDPAEVEDNTISAAKLMAGDGTMFELQKIIRRNGAKRMISEISAPCKDPLDKAVTWKKVSLPDLEDLGAAGFKAKDVQALEKIYSDTHELMPGELDAITGKAIPLLSEG